MANKVKRCKDVSTFLEKYLRKIEVSPSDHSQLPMITQTYEHESSTIDDRLLDLEEELEKLRLRRDEELKRTTQAQPSDPLQLTATIGIFADNGGEAEIALIYGSSRQRPCFICFNALYSRPWCFLASQL